MTDPTEVNRYLATEVMNVEWHEITCKAIGESRCVCGEKVEYHPVAGFLFGHHQPNYLTNLPDRQDLLEACVDKEWWRDFVLKIICKIDPCKIDVVFKKLFAPKDALATAIYRYRKGEEDGR